MWIQSRAGDFVGREAFSRPRSPVLQERPTAATLARNVDVELDPSAYHFTNGPCEFDWTTARPARRRTRCGRLGRPLCRWFASPLTPVTRRALRQRLVPDGGRERKRPAGDQLLDARAHLHRADDPLERHRHRHAGLDEHPGAGDGSARGRLCEAGAATERSGHALGRRPVRHAHGGRRSDLHHLHLRYLHLFQLLHVVHRGPNATTLHHVPRWPLLQRGPVPELLAGDRVR